MEIERRLTVSEASIEYRSAEDGEKRPTIVGYASVFNSPSRNLGGFIETVHPAAFDDVLSSNPDVLGLFNHDKNKLLARTGNGSMKLSVDPYGLRYEMSLPSTRDAEDVATMVREKLVTGSSFSFAVKKNGGDAWGADTSGMKKREIRSVALVEDVGPVVRPAYDASSVVVSRRCLEMALGENYRPNQTMANAARRGLRAAEKRDDVDQQVLAIAERMVAREVLSLEEVGHLAEIHKRCSAAREAGWTASTAYVEWLLAGAESGEKWVERRSEVIVEPPVDAVPPPAVETPAESRAATISLKPSAGMAAACRRGLKLYEDGRGGDGLVAETISWAKKIAARESLTEEKVIKMRAWHARHKVDKRPGWDKAGEETPGFVAFLLWAGAAGAKWSAMKVAQMERAEKRDLMEEEDMVALSPANIRLYEAIDDIVEEYGPWPQDGAAGAHYMESSPFAERGMKCANCVFYEEGACEVVQGSINPNGLCKLWIIPEDKMNDEAKRSESAVADEDAVASATPESQEPTPAPAQEPVEPAPSDDDVTAALVKMAQLNAALLRTRLHDMQQGQ